MCTSATSAHRQASEHSQLIHRFGLPEQANEKVDCMIDCMENGRAGKKQLPGHDSPAEGWVLYTLALSTHQCVSEYQWLEHPCWLAEHAKREVESMNDTRKSGTSGTCQLLGHADPAGGLRLYAPCWPAAAAALPLHCPVTPA